MPKDHLRRLNTPKSWPIKRKNIKYIKRPNPGAHPIKLGIPLTVLLRDLMGIAKTFKEVRRMLHNKEVFVDERRVKEPKFNVGLFDTITLLKDSYRVIVAQNKRLAVTTITKDEAKLKPCKIIGKTKVKGKAQINLYDARNILVDKEEYKVGDTILIELPSQKIKDHIKLEKGALIFLIGGKHMGDMGHIEGIFNNRIIYKNKESEKIETLNKYAFVIGKEKPLVKIE
ncbi:MAG: 30S ribosomal protein S4e [Nanoarchaeota archaeon]|nr:30S ribosomal protein S4e [Nanoarchaeota archaeon]MBU1704435.1 30S ribosomal protein S4e [Nanoarchaeota archaeon]